MNLKVLKFALEEIIFLPIKIVKNSSKILMTGAFYYGIFLVYESTNKNEIKVKFDETNRNKKQFVKVKVTESNNLPFDIVIDKDELDKKPFGKVAVNGKILWFAKPISRLVKRGINNLVEKKGEFGIDLKDDEILTSVYENHDPFFETFDEYEKNLYDCLDENNNV